MDPRYAQTQLASLGLYTGEIDGKWGDLSQAAWDKLVAFYRANNQAAAKPVPAQGWVWDQSEGRLYRAGKFVAAGYSGKGAARNNPTMETVVGTGPIPRGAWKIGPARVSVKTGPVAMDLYPVGHNAHGRSAFQIHGDNATGTASSGCIILPRNIREQINASADKTLTVIQ